MDTFIESKFPLAIIITIFVVFSSWSPFFSFSRQGITDALIGTPEYWFDEGFAVEAARGLASLGRLDIAVEPGVLLGKPYFAGGSGFPVSTPLAAVFSLFGFGILQIRLFAVLWLFLALVSL